MSSDLYNLRLVSRYLNEFISPLLFLNLCLRIKAGGTFAEDLQRTISIITAIASGKSGTLFQRTTTLFFDFSGLYGYRPGMSPRLAEAANVIETSLVAAISELQNLCSIQ